MKILAVGDIVGSAGINELKLRLKEIKEKENIYKNDRLVKRISETEEKEYYYDQWQNIGRESILLKVMAKLREHFVIY